MNFKHVLALSPHTDDVEYGCGGTIARLIDGGSHVKCIAFWGTPLLRQECGRALTILGVRDYQVLAFERRRYPEQRQEILQFLYDYDCENDVDLVLTPTTYDLHQDHQTITNEVRRAFKNSTILGYVFPKNTLESRVNCFIALEEKHLKKKIDSVLEYKSQIEKRPFWFNENYIRSLATTWGGHIMEKYAEAFEIIKMVWK